MVAPCKNCERKGCGVYHSQCERYMAFKEQQENAYKERVFICDMYSLKTRAYVEKLRRSKR